MNLKVFAALDAVVGAFLQPFFCRSRGEAIRSFEAAVTDGKSQLSAHSKDYSLYEIGEWSDDDGKLLPIEPQRICGGADFIRSAE